jgi:hypothetical protein
MNNPLPNLPERAWSALHADIRDTKAKGFEQLSALGEVVRQMKGRK